MRTKRQTNGFDMLKQNVTVGEPDLKTQAMAGKLSLVAELPKTWATALEAVRKAAGYGSTRMLAAALATPRMPCTASDVMRWEAARALPAIAQIQRLRELLPALVRCDELLPLALRQSGTVVSKPQAAAEGWTGPPVTSFGEALRHARQKAGMSQADMARLIGVVVATYGNYENRTRPMISEIWHRIVAELPQMAFAPKPTFSAMYKNAFRGKGYLASEAARREEHRAEAEWAKPEETRKAPPVHVPETPNFDNTKLVMAGAAYGALQAERRGLLSQAAQLKRNHDRELEAMAEKHSREDADHAAKIGDIDGRILEAVARMDLEADAAHGVTP